MKKVEICPSNESLLLWLYKKPGQGWIFGNMYEIPQGYYGLKVPRDEHDDFDIDPGNRGKVKRRSALYIVRLLPFEPLGWGIGSLPCVTVDGDMATVGVNGTFCFSVELPRMLYETTTDIGNNVSMESFRRRIVTLMGNEIINSFKPTTVKRLNAVSQAIHSCRSNIDIIFSSFGTKLESLTVDGITQ